MIPVSLVKSGNWSATIFHSNRDMRDVDFVDGVNLCYVPNYIFISGFLKIFIKLKGFTHVMIYHGALKTLLWLFLIKTFRPSLFTYVKLDIGEIDVLERAMSIRNEGLIKRRLRRYLESKVDIFTVESYKVKNMIDEFQLINNSVYVIPNGYDGRVDNAGPFKKKEVVLISGRIGVPQKNNYLILEGMRKALAETEVGFIFMGAMSESFEKELFKLASEYEGRIKLMGYVENIDTINNIYKESKYICFSSIYEGFSLAFVEAVSFGCIPISTDLAAMDQIFKERASNYLVNVNDDLYKELTEKGVVSIVNYVNENYDLLIKSPWFFKASERFSNLMLSILNEYKEVDISTDISMLVEEHYTWDEISKELNSIILRG
ncbi:glycosyltransferase [Marinomonas communis]|uniref:glycosyltransferase n=1 Tax=Marinomonas communis TaxID=28254 RepID=UPI001D18988A|nr:glycosyltransferase [Marinomonas communis]MCC4275238.1 glycosyltransferase [Marinomonas communis]